MYQYWNEGPGGSTAGRTHEPERLGQTCGTHESFVDLWVCGACQFPNRAVTEPAELFCRPVLPPAAPSSARAGNGASCAAGRGPCSVAMTSDLDR